MLRSETIQEENNEQYTTSSSLPEDFVGTTDYESAFPAGLISDHHEELEAIPQSQEASFAKLWAKHAILSSAINNHKMGVKNAESKRIKTQAILKIMSRLATAL